MLMIGPPLQSFGPILGSRISIQPLINLLSHTLVDNHIQQEEDKIIIKLHQLETKMHQIVINSMAVQQVLPEQALMAPTEETQTSTITAMSPVALLEKLVKR